MNAVQLNAPDIATLTALANGVIPADQRDAGAAAVHAGPIIAERVCRGVNGALYAEGLETAKRLAREKFGRDPADLTPAEIHELLGAVEKVLPRYFRQLRMDVCALYMSDSTVWQRIGFPGPSTDTGGYPDFDQPQ